MNFRFHMFFLKFVINIFIAVLAIKRRHLNNIFSTINEIDKRYSRYL